MRWWMMLAASWAVLVLTCITRADSYPTQVWPSTATVEALNGTTDSTTGLPYIAVGTSPSSTPSLRVQIDRRWARQNEILASANAMRVVKVADLAIGAFPGFFRLAGTNYEYDGETSVASDPSNGTDLSDGDDTYYVWMDSTEALRMAPDGTGWPGDMTTYVPLAEVTVASSAITGIVDVRSRVWFATWSGGGGGALDSYDHTDSNFLVADGATWVVETGATARASMGVTIGTDVQAYHANLAALAGLAGPATQSVFLYNAVGDIDKASINDLGKEIIYAASTSALRTTIGTAIGTDVQAYDALLQAIAGVSTNGLMEVTGSGSGVSSVTITTQGKDLINDADASAMRSTLGVVIGTDVQAYGYGLETIRGLPMTDSNVIVGNGTAWVAESGATARTSLGLAIGTDVQAYDADLAGVASNSNNGMIARTSEGNFTGRTITAVTGLVTTNGNGVSGNPTIARETDVETLTGQTLTTSMAFDCINNLGASVMAEYGLPGAAAGLEYEFTVIDADGIKIVPNTGDGIYIDSSYADAGSSQYISSTTVGSALRVVAISSTVWIVTSYTGTWAVGP